MSGSGLLERGMDMRDLLLGIMGVRVIVVVDDEDDGVLKNGGRRHCGKGGEDEK